MSISMRFNVLRVIMAREINEKFAELHEDIDRQFDELADRFKPAVNASWPLSYRAEHEALRNASMNMGMSDMLNSLNARQGNVFYEAHRNAMSTGTGFLRVESIDPHQIYALDPVNK